MPDETGRSAAGAAVSALAFEKPLALMEREIQQLEASQSETGRDYSDTIKAIRSEIESALKKTYANLSPWETVMVARHPKRPLLRDYIRMIAKDYCELHGDRLSGDDGALICGFARVAGHKVMLIGHQKGRDTREKIAANFGCAHPEGYRKALQKMKLAAKFKLPVVCLIDTPGAYPGVESEERGIAQAIAVNLMEMAVLPTPVVAVVIGEGGSGGALGIGVADQMAVMQHAYYSVISPEGCAAILWKSGEHAQQAASALKFTPGDLLKMNLIDAVIPEPLGGAHRDPELAARSVESWIGHKLRDLRRLKIETVLKRRYDKIRSFGSGSICVPAAETAPARKPRGKRSASTVQKPTPVVARA